MTDEPRPAVVSPSQFKTLAVRITDEMRAQLDILAQLTGRTVTDEIRRALESWIAQSKSDPTVLKQAEAVRAEIEREAQTRRNAIDSIFDADGKPAGAKRSPGRTAATPKA